MFLINCSVNVYDRVQTVTLAQVAAVLDSYSCVSIGLSLSIINQFGSHLNYAYSMTYYFAFGLEYLSFELVITVSRRLLDTKALLECNLG